MKFKVVEFKINPAAVGQPRLVDGMNIPQSTISTGRIVGKDLTESKAKALRDRLNGKQDLQDNLSIMMSYVVKPQ